MYAFTFERPSTAADAAKLAASGAKVLAGGQTLLASMKLRLSNPATLADLGGIKELAGIRKDGNNLVIGAMTRHADDCRERRRQDGHPGAGRPGWPHRRQAGARAGHAGRLGGQQRSRSLLPQRGARPGRYGADHTTPDRRRRLLPGHVHDRAGGRRADHRDQLSGAQARRLHEVQAAGLALCADRRVRRADGWWRARCRDRRWQRGVPSQGAGRRIEQELHAGCSGRREDRRQRPWQRYPRIGGLSGQPDQRDDAARCGEGLGESPPRSAFGASRAPQRQPVPRPRLRVLQPGV